MGSPLSLRAYRAFERAATSALGRRLGLVAAHVLLLFRAVAPGMLVQRLVLGFVRMEAACCSAGSPHYKFLARFLDRFEEAGTFERMRRFLREQPRARAAAALDAWLRIGLLGTLRHEVLNRHLGKHGVPPRLLVEAQLALSPGCDLACEGCYTAEDRGGAAPRRARIAALVDDLVACGALCVHVVGKGEPFLSPTWANELLDVIAARPHVYFTIATHGMHIDDRLAERLGRLGNALVLVAIDGDEDVHEARRGSGSYARVQAALARLEANGAVFGFSCMVSKKSLEVLTSREVIDERARAGCVVGIYSRYFPLTGESQDALALSASELARYREGFEAVRADARVLLLDLDDVEQHTGCHSRAGESVYIDGITGRVAPCLRVPFAPPDCNVDLGLAVALAHPYFTAYRARDASSCPSWCGANLGAELESVSTLLAEHQPPRLVQYRRRLPLLDRPEVRP